MFDKKERGPSPRPLQGVLLLSLLMFGCFYEWGACIAGLSLLACLLYYFNISHILRIPKTPALLACTALELFFLLGGLWSTEHGMALLGFIKFLPLPLFLLCAAQLSAEDRDALWSPLPWAGVGMTGLSLLLSRIGRLSALFLVNGRLAGFFQYPNTFALFLLVCVCIVLFRGSLGRTALIQLAVLLAGIAFSGSRTVFLMLAGVLIYFIIVHKEKRDRAAVIGLGVTLIVLTGLYALLTGNLSSAGRYLTTSLSSTTFLGRLLYYRDALPVILRHPLGLGYTAYSTTQGGFKTGVYHILHVHNDLLQVMLDAGWLPGLLFLWAVFRVLRKNSGAGRLQKLLVIVMGLHCLFDFDMQFVSISMLLLLAMSGESGGKPFLLRSPAAVRLGCGVLAALCLYLGAASGLHYLKNDRAAAAIYPGYTEAWVQVLSQTEDPAEMEAVADRILGLNDQISIAWSAKARCAFARGEIGQMIDCKKKAISLQRYFVDEYTDYFDMLETGMLLYRQAGDEDSARFCLDELRQIPELLDRVRTETSALGWRIQNQPVTTLPQEYLDRLAAYEGY